MIVFGVLGLVVTELKGPDIWIFVGALTLGLAFLIIGLLLFRKKTIEIT